MEKEINYQMNLADWKVTNNGTVREVMSRELNLSRKEISRLKFDGEILLNGERVKVNDHMRVGDTLTLRFPEIKTESIPAVDAEPEILYEDEDLVIVNKPAGIPCHPVHGHTKDSMGTILASWYMRSGTEFVIRPVGRLDMDVSGAIIYAKNRLAAARLSRDREEGKLKKYYTAFVSGVLETKSGIIDEPIMKVEGQRRRAAGAEEGKPAKTMYQVTHEFHVGDQSISILAVEIETGRTHQIRAHLASIGHPLIGDELYGGDRALMNRPALHCAEIDFLTPFSRQGWQVNAPFPPDMAALLEGPQPVMVQEETPEEAKPEREIKPVPAVKEQRAEDRIREFLETTEEMPEVDEPAVREKTAEERKLSARALIGFVILALIAGIVAGVFLLNRKNSRGSVTKEKEALFSSLMVEFKPETIVEYGGDFHPSDYVASAAGTLTVEGTVDTMVPGSQEVRYIVSDEASDGSEVSREFVREFTVKDTLEPLITLKQDEVRIALNEDYDPKLNVKSVRDPVDGDLEYELDGEAFLKDQPGTYTIRISASDSSGNQSSKTFRIVVGQEQTETEKKEEAAEPSASPEPVLSKDTSAPSILLSASSLSLSEGDAFSAGSLITSVKDETDGDLLYTETLAPGTYTVASDVNPDVPGDYLVTVTAIDRAGNRAEETVPVMVMEKKTPEPTPEPTKAAVVSVPDSSNPKQQIYNFLTGTMGFNKAQACGILANMHRESRFNPQADNGIGYYGLCQWGFERLDNLKSWCEANGYDYTTIDGQLHFLQYEMPLYYPNTTAQFRETENDEEGARRACWIFAIGYEVAGEYYAEMSMDKAAEYFNE